MKNKFILMCMLFVAAMHKSQLTPTENYIYTKTYLSDPTLASPKTAETVKYMDGLGRPKQSISIKATPNNKDVVIPVEYDSFGRQVKNYLPIPQSGTQGGGIYAAPAANQSAVYGNERIYSESILENTPVDRIKQQFNVGNDWAGKSVSFDYDLNASGEVKKYIASFNYSTSVSSLSIAGSYGENQLFKTTVTDEDGNATIEFKDGQGKTILVRKVLNASESTDTYYVYNEYNQLAYVIPPLASVLPSISPSDLDTLCYQYKYDERNKLVEKKIPGKGWEYMVYDHQDRLVMAQDANLRDQGKWIFTKYDNFGRVVYTGIISGGDRSSMQSTVSNADIIEARDAAGFSKNGMQVYYTNTYFSGLETILSVNYYDTYPAGTPAIPSSILGQEVLTQDAVNSAISTKTLPTASYVKNMEDDNWTKNYIWYDTKGRAIGSHSVNHLGGYTKTESELGFAGEVQQAMTYHKRLGADNETIIKETFTYDNQNRLLTHTHKVNASPEETLAENTYNELSQLTHKTVGGNLQTIDYTYNIRGALTQVNDPANLGIRLFGYKLKYINPENTAEATGKYNGNITEVDWKTATDNVLRRYNYQYDGLNRLKKGVYSEPYASVPQNGFYNETVAYDLNGNISSLQRNGRGGSGMAEQIDNLAYTYTGNRLQTVVDSSGNYAGYPDTSGTQIPYDANGNMTSHEDKGVVSIKYNNLNLPGEIKFNTTYSIRNPQTGEDEIRNIRTNYTYRADGTKLRKKYTNYLSKFKAERTTTTDYLDGFQYTINYLGVVSPDFVPTSEGYYDFKNNKYIYSYTDHLGNVRLSYFKNTGGSAEVLEENNYYPFGLKHVGYNQTEGNPAYKYQYNGKELQEETGWNDYGARMYMSDIGRWGVVDPLAETSRRWSPYTYAFNNPVRFIDPDGREAAESSSGMSFTGESAVSLGAMLIEQAKANVIKAKEKENELGNSESFVEEKPWTPLGLISGVDFSKFDFSQDDGDDKGRNPLIRQDGSRITNADVNGDGKITLQELGYWYRHGKGTTITIPASSIDLSGVDPNLFKGKKINQSVAVNLFYTDFFGEGTLYGDLEFIYKGGNKVAISQNKYDFDIGASQGHPWFDSFSGFARNLGTLAGNIVAGSGQGFMIKFKGTANLKFDPNKKK